MNDQKPRILAIDDTPANLLMLGRALAPEFVVQVATSGATGLALAREAPPDLILLDVMMPEMDGYETCRRIKAEPLLAQIPVIFVTALAGIEAETEGLKLGVADYIIKPVNVEIARQRIRNLLERERLRKELEAQRDILEAQIALRDQTAQILRESEERLRLALSASHQGWFDVDLRNGNVAVSDEYPIMLGYDPKEFESSLQNWLAHIHPDDRDKVYATFQESTKDDSQSAMEYRRQTKTGAWKWIRSVGKVVERDAQQQATRMIGIHTDITERKLSEEALRDSELRYRRLADNSPLAIQVFRPDGTTVRVNAAWERLWQAPFSALENYNVLKDPQLEALGFLPILKRAFAGETVVFPVHMYDKARTEGVAHSGGRLWLHAFAYPVQGEDGELLEVVLFQEDITEQKLLEDKVHRLAFYDALTQLPNRRLLSDRLNQAMAANKRSNHFGALMFLDLDNFKPLNDAHGHSVGDLLLIETADRLKSCMREMDTVARFGGDEFVVILSDLTSDKTESTRQAAIVAEKVRSTLSEPYHLKIKCGNEPDTTIVHQCTVSIGVVMFPSNDISQEEIFSQADLAMYQAKKAGRNLIRFYELEAGVAA